MISFSLTGKIGAPPRRAATLYTSAQDFFNQFFVLRRRDKFAFCEITKCFED